MSPRARIRRIVAARPVSALFARLSPASELNLADTLRTERAGGALLLLGAAAALIWANSAARDGYEAMRQLTFGPAALHLDLTLEQWATDGLLTLFFFVVGLELKREIVDGELRRPATAALPIVAAVGGMLVPAGLYLAVNLTVAGGDPRGWAVPTATDIAFAVAVLAVVGRSLPNALRAFLLTLAVVDDLLAIVVIAVFYSASIDLPLLGLSLLAVGLFGLAVQRRVTTPFLLVPLALLAWGLMHASGVHATIAGVALGLVVPGLARADEREALAARFEHVWRPVSAGFAVPVFALFAAGVALDPAALAAAAADPVAQGVALGLVLGKPIGIVLATWLVATITRTPLAPGLSWADVVAVGFVAGIGFTVSLLIGALAFGEGSASGDHVRAAVLVASLVAALAGGALLAARDRHHRSVPAAVVER
ncbi:Na+/H+ antiporter NhaA [Actinotalea sp.]|uniref:Na+/H+ antiporter NhaA n=1 Tax=Actinotalea sp. TaxID=1872145 RepID=UPI002C72ECFF|nr:Na+/H+ antiporter NhaA [Actinotalea sp.]HQY34141.1 Na+/H+ antiporter NhaA [Actinotalea sp.]HRA50865.1 Na+/H+ antiporter NhaA [Actinotalea sp.]